VTVEPRAEEGYDDAIQRVMERWLVEAEAAAEGETAPDASTATQDLQAKVTEFVQHLREATRSEHPETDPSTVRAELARLVAARLEQVEHEVAQIRRSAQEEVARLRAQSVEVMVKRVQQAEEEVVALKASAVKEADALRAGLRDAVRQAQEQANVVRERISEAVSSCQALISGVADAADSLGQLAGFEVTEAAPVSTNGDSPEAAAEQVQVESSGDAG
jgi:hypothetical protein